MKKSIISYCQISLKSKFLLYPKCFSIVILRRYAISKYIFVANFSKACPTIIPCPTKKFHKIKNLDKREMRFQLLAGLPCSSKSIFLLQDYLQNNFNPYNLSKLFLISNTLGLKLWHYTMSKYCQWVDLTYFWINYRHQIGGWNFKF